METAELKVVKRDDSVEDFDIKKIERAIARACQETHDAEGEKNASIVAEKALDEFSGKIKNNSVGIEDIQDGVELALIDTGHKQTALAYARYREKHAQMRNGLNYGKLVDDYLGQNDWRVKENATVNFSLGGLVLSNNGAVTANYWLNDIYDKEIADAHRNADLHLHDLSLLNGYCAGWSLKQLINEGLGGVPGKIASTPASHLSTLCNQMVNFLGCFTDDTRIVFADGTNHSIREMLDSGKTEFMVRSFDPNTGKYVASKMDNLHKTRTVSQLIELTTEDGHKIKCTLDHKFYTLNRGWVEAQDLTEDDDVLQYNSKVMYVYKFTCKDTGECMKIVSKRIINQTSDVYCGTVHNDFHAFFVTDSESSDTSICARNCLQNEWSGAQAFSSFDTYLAPFVKKDNLSYKEVKQAIQSFIFGVNTPSRWGCVDTDTEVLSTGGWKKYDQLKKGDDIYVWDNGTLTTKKVNEVVVKPYKGEMHRYLGAGYEQTVTPEHRILVKKFNLNEYEIKHSSDIFSVKTSYYLPASFSGNDLPECGLSDDEIKLAAMVYTDGSIDVRNGSIHKITIYKSPKRPGNADIANVANSLSLAFSLCEVKGGFDTPVNKYVFFGDSARKIFELVGGTKKAIDDKFVKMSRRQSELFLRTWSSFDGDFEKFKLQYDNDEIADRLQEIALRAGFLSFKKKTSKANYVRVHDVKNIQPKHREAIQYDGLVWCPNDDAGTAIFRKNGCVFISGQCQAPFTNVTLDWVVPDDLKNLPAVVGGKMQDFTYGECQKEADMVNKAFIETMIEGDANGRGFQYPIPTYSITKGFDWSDTENNRLLFEMAAKYGIPYFSNYINSSMNPQDCRSMCPLTSDTEILVKNSRDGIVVRKIGTLYDGYNLKKTNYLFWNGHKWVSGHPVQMPMTPVFKIVLSNGTTVKMGENHLQPTKDRGTLKASDLEVGDWLPFNKTPIETERLGDSDLGFAIGAYAGDGSHDEGAVVYSLNVDVDQDTVSRLTAFWNRVGYPVKTTVSEKVEYVRVDKNPFAIVSEYIDGDALTKKLSNRCFNASNEFKEGFISGLRASDGSKEKKRIYTSSETMKNDVMKLLASMGHKALSNYVDNRESRLSDKPNYRIDFPDRERYGELFDQDDSYNYYKIVSIEKTNDASSDFLYCLEIDSDDHVFALASGLMTHNCRLRLDLRELRKRNGGFFGAGESTGSIGVVTINMPRIGYLAADKDDFYARLDHMMDIAARSLEIKRKTITDLYNRGLYPYTKRYLGETAFKNHFSTIGLVGMNEACLNAKWLKDDLTHKDAQDFTVEVLNHMRNRLSDYQVQYPSTLFNLEATPAESTCVSGDTNVWTDKGRMTVNDIIADKNKNIGIMSFNAETNSVEFKKLVDCWKTKKDAEVMKITFSNGDSVKVTPNHKMAKRFVTGCGPSRKCWIDYVEAGSLKVGDRLFACHVYTKNSKAYGETYRNVECVLGKNKGSFPMHRLLAEYYYGKIPDGFVVHHKDFDKTNNAKDNLEIMSDADHRRLHEHDEGRNFVRCVDGSANPFFGKHHTEKSKELISETKRETKDEWYPKFLENMASEDTRRKMSEGNKKKSFEQYSRYMPECSTEAIIAKWKENKSIGEIAKELGEPYTYSLVKSRLKHAGLLPNHQIVKIEYLTEREDVYDLEVEGNHNFFISGGVDDAVLVHNCFRLAKHDKEMYPDIITAGKSGETPYYTNSSHLPVGYTDDMFSALDVEDRFQTLYTSGTVFHAFLGQRLPDWHSCMRLVRKIAENYKLPYFTMSPTYSICPDHGYIVGEKWKCPICGKETEVYSRITGYYRPLKNWNAGKMQEFHDRKEYDSSKEEVHDGCNACSLENKNISAEAPKVDHLMLFTNPTCPNCKMAKMLLDKAGIKYDNIDASTHLDQVNAFGITAAPTMIVPDGASFDVYRNASEIAGWIKSRSNA